jgi:hypothetical protein
MSESKFTHTLWMPYYLDRKFFRWYEAGMGYVTKDENGVETPHIFEHMHSRGTPRGYSRFLPNGMKPPDLAEKPKRPSGDDETPDDLSD